MKKAKRLLSAVMIGVCLCSCMLVGAGAAENVGKLPAKGAEAYLDVIADLQKTAGKAKADAGFGGLWTGMAFAKLVDFDGDGIPELYCAYGLPKDNCVCHQGIWTYQDGQAKKIFHTDRSSNFGTDVSPASVVYVGNNKAYLFLGQAGKAEFYAKQGSQMVVVFQYMDRFFDEPVYTAVNGKTVSRQEMERQIAQFTAGMTEQYYTYYTTGWGNTLDPVKAMSDTISALNALATVAVNPSTNKVTVDGTAVQLAAYKINGSNYFKLRDLAAVLNGTSKQFAVQWLAQEKQIALTSGEPYTPDGSENKPLGAGSAAASESSAAVRLNGKVLNLTAYTIDSNNYFSLRDLGNALGFTVSFDEASQTVQITTN